MLQEQAIIIKQENFQGDYRVLHMNAPKIGPLVTPGQFIHLKVPKLNDRILLDATVIVSENEILIFSNIIIVIKIFFIWISNIKIT